MDSESLILASKIIEKDVKTIAVLRNELAAANAEISRLTENQRLQDGATAAVMERAEKAEGELAACREDAERIDHLEAFRQRMISKGYAWNNYVFKADTSIREQIDAARKERA